MEREEGRDFQRSVVDERLVLTRAEQRRADEATHRGGAAEDALTESAGRSAAEWILTHAATRRVVVAAGPGGNGADALVVARHLLAAGSEVKTFLLSPSGQLSAPARRMLERLTMAGGSATCLEATGVEGLADALAWGTLAVDGLFGTGLARPLAGLAAATIRTWNAASVRTVSLDVPSGAVSDSGDLVGPVISADVTLAMEFLKPVHLLFPAASRCGSVAVIPVDYPDDVLARVSPLARVLERSGVAHRLPPRPPDGHKGTFGRVLVVAGSVGMTGAAILACRGALRVGAGLVVLAVPASLDPILEVALPEVITIPVPDAGGRFGPAAVGALRDELARADALAIGPGLSRAGETVTATLAILRGFRGPCVVDADALYALSKDPELLSSMSTRGLLTPHPGELAFLTGELAGDLAHDRMDATRAFVESRGVTTVLKGRPTVVGLRGGDLYLNPTGNTGLATGGSGDVLTGILAGLIAGGASIADAAVVGPYLHGMAAETFASDRSERSLLPSDVIELLPRVLREVEQCG
jgi:hydroxyethylthiazole kinase-like uncharacterized protein yjeF